MKYDILKEFVSKTVSFLSKNKKGTAMVEATIVIPIIFLSLMAVVNLEIKMYQKIETQTNYHRELREKEKEFVSDYVRKIDVIVEISDNLK